MKNAAARERRGLAFSMPAVYWFESAALDRVMSVWRGCCVWTRAHHVVSPHSEQARVESFLETRGARLLVQTPAPSSPSLEQQRSAACSAAPCARAAAAAAVKTHCPAQREALFPARLLQTCRFKGELEDSTGADTRTAAEARSSHFFAGACVMRERQRRLCVHGDPPAHSHCPARRISKFVRS